MLHDVGARPEHSFFLAGPQRETHRAPHLRITRFQYAHRFHHHCGAGGVVGGAGAARPGIEMRAKHHDFIGLVRARNFRDDVERIQVVVVILVRDVDLQLHRNVFLKRAEDAPVVFDVHGDAREHWRVFRVARAPAHHGYCAAVVRRGFKPRHGALVGQKLHELLVEFPLFALPVARCVVERWLWRARLREVGQLLIGEAMRRRLELRFDHAHRRGQHKHAPEPPAIEGEIFFFFDFGVNCIGCDGTVRSRRPRRNFGRFK